MTTPRWVLSAHAATVVRERGLQAEWIARVLNSPNRVEADRADLTLRHALAGIAERGGRVRKLTP